MQEKINHFGSDKELKELELAVSALRAVYDVLKLPPANTTPQNDILLIYGRLLEKIQRQSILLSQIWPTNKK